MNDIVSLTTADVSRAIPVTTSRIIAEEFGKRHDNVMKAIQEVLKSKVVSESNLLHFKDIEYTDSKGRKQSEIQMNEPAFALVVMGFTGEKAMKAKLVFINEFYRMRAELLARTETRKIGKAARLSITDAIKNHVSPDGNFKKFAYGNYTKLVYKRVLGKDVKRSKAERKCPESGNLRDYLTIEELDRVQELESKIAGFIEVSDTEGKDDKQIYQMVKAWLDSVRPQSIDRAGVVWTNYIMPIGETVKIPQAQKEA